MRFYIFSYMCVIYIIFGRIFGTQEVQLGFIIQMYVLEGNTVIFDIILTTFPGLKTQWRETALSYPLFFGVAKHQHIASQQYF